MSKLLKAEKAEGARFAVYTSLLLLCYHYYLLSHANLLHHSVASKRIPEGKPVCQRPNHEQTEAAEGPFNLQPFGHVRRKVIRL